MTAAKSVEPFLFNFAVDTHGYNVNWKVNVRLTGPHDLQLTLYCEKVGPRPAWGEWRTHSARDVFPLFAYSDFPQAEVEQLYSRFVPDPLELTLKLSELLPLIPTIEALVLDAVEDLPLQDGVPAPRLQALQDFCSLHSSNMDSIGVQA